jgi:Ca2+-transporting ATPase
MSKRNVLTRKIPAIETLGSATVLCVDKTGTITQNRMEVQKFYASGEMCDYNTAVTSSVPDSCHELAEYSILACKRDPFDPMEKALQQLADGSLGMTEHIHRDWDLVQEYPLSEDLLVMSNVWRSPDGTEYVIAAKGAPEAIADLCHLNAGAMQDLLAPINVMAADGLRVIGVAKASFSIKNLPERQHDFHFEFLGLVGFADPIRPGIAEAISECREARIRVVMITGDYPLTAQNIARRIGLLPADQIITGAELDAMSGEELSERIKTASIFARVVPEQKLRIVSALRANGEVVAMTGDGVNDAPALRSADIGIAMGGRGTDVARESSSLVLTDDDFPSIVAAVRMGRRIFDNIRKAIAYTISVHVPIAGMVLIPVLFGWPLILLPMHIVFLELIIDPACSIAFEGEKEDADIMRRMPRKKDEGLFSRRMLEISLVQGFVVLAVVLVLYAWAIGKGASEQEARALTFTAIVTANLMLIFCNRSWKETLTTTLRSPNRALWWITGGAIFFMGLILLVPALQNLFKFSPPAPADLLICISAGVAGVVWFEIFKVWMKGVGADLV